MFLKKGALLILGTAMGLLIAEGALRWVLPSNLVYVHPHFYVEDVAPDEAEIQTAQPMFGAVLQYVDQPWKYRLKRNLRARFVSSEFDVAFETNDLGLRGPKLNDGIATRSRTRRLVLHGFRRGTGRDISGGTGAPAS